MALAIPAYSYTGSHAATSDNSYWYIFLNSSGTLKFNCAHTVDIFLVGGGGPGGAEHPYTTSFAAAGGGGGGYTGMVSGQALAAGTNYPAVIGAGGTATIYWDSSTDTYPTSYVNGGNTSLAGHAVAGGAHGNTGTYGWGDNYSHYATGGAGGSGGGGYAAGVGGSNGGSGGTGTNPGHVAASGGAGQGTTTYEFGVAGRTLYAGGGGGPGRWDFAGGAGGSGGGGAGATYRGWQASSGSANLGGGGGASHNTGPAVDANGTNLPGGSGGSGRIVLRGRTADISACGAPTACTLSAAASTGANVTLSWSGASAGANNAITGYDIYRREYDAAKGTWGAYAAYTSVNSTATSGSLSVPVPATLNNQYQYEVRTKGSAGASYYSGFKASSNTVKRSALPVTFNGQALTEIIYNGTRLTSLTCNSTKLF